MQAIMDRVFIRPDAPKKGVIIIKENEEAKSGIVVSVGKEVKSVQQGDHVLYFKWDDLILPNGLVAVREKSLLGVYQQEEKDK